MTARETNAPDVTGPAELSLAEVQAVLARHIPLYRTHAPAYQLVMLRSLRTVWKTAHRRVLDVGGGTGIIAQAIKELFGVKQVTSVDISDRFLKSLDIETLVYDGIKLPFADGSFECATFNNVLHHVPVEARAGLMRECARVVGGGPIYIKDHEAASRLDHARLVVLDALGNVPFGGMVQAQYLTAGDWQQLAGDCGYRIDERVTGPYRAGVFERVFPNRLEVTMRWVRR